MPRLAWTTGADPGRAVRTATAWTRAFQGSLLQNSPAPFPTAVCCCVLLLLLKEAQTTSGSTGQVPPPPAHTQERCCCSCQWLLELLMPCMLLLLLMWLCCWCSCVVAVAAVAVAVPVTSCHWQLPKLGCVQAVQPLNPPSPLTPQPYQPTARHIASHLHALTSSSSSRSLPSWEPEIGTRTEADPTVWRLRQAWARPARESSRSLPSWEPEIGTGTEADPTVWRLMQAWTRPARESDRSLLSLEPGAWNENGSRSYRLEANAGLGTSRSGIGSVFAFFGA